MISGRRQHRASDFREDGRAPRRLRTQARTYVHAGDLRGLLDITAQGPGSGQITISSADVESAILGVTVYMKLATVEVSSSAADLDVDGTTTLTATVADANGNSMHVNQNDGRGGLTVYWETSDSAVVTVGDSRGLGRQRGPQYRRFRHGDGGRSRHGDHYRQVG